MALFDLDKNRVIIKGDQTAQEEEENDDSGGDRNNRQTKRYELPKDVRLDKAILGEGEIDSGLFQIIFFSTGGSSGGELVLSNDRGNRYQVKVDFITGTVRLGSYET